MTLGAEEHTNSSLFSHQSITFKLILTFSSIFVGVYLIRNHQSLFIVAIEVSQWFIPSFHMPICRCIELLICKAGFMRFFAVLLRL